MKRSFKILLFIFFAGIISANAQMPMRRATPNDTLKSVRILPDGDVIFSIYAPEAKNVSLSGDIIDWSKPLDISKTDNGIWKITIPKAAAGVYRYSFIVDGIKVYDPKAPDAYETNALVKIQPEGENEFFAMRENVPHGAMSEVHYYSKTTGSMRRMHIWTPAGYNASNKELPVLYLIHGGGDSDKAWPNVGSAGFIVDNLLSEAKCKEMIIVMPDGGIDTKIFAQDLGHDIIPYIETNYRVKKDAANRAIAGLSMGGLETMDAFMAFPDKFAYINVMSSGWFTNNTKMIEDGDARLAEIAPVLNKTVKLLVVTQGGPEDIAYNNCLEMLKIFDKNRIKYEFSEISGGHSWHVWRHDLLQFAQRIFK